MATKVKSTKLTTNTNKLIKGHFKLTDGTTTKFEVDNNGEWNQWGNNTDNLCLTTNRVMLFVESLINKN